MKSFYARGVALALGLISLAPSQAQESFGSPSLLPLPAVSPSYPAQQVAYENLWADPPAAPSPSKAEELPSPSDQSVISGDYQAAMSSGWGGSCTSGVCGQGCCQNNWFGYAGGLLMTRSGSNKFNVSFDTGGPNTVICSCHTDMELSGGFEITAGRTFNCGCNALAVTYWGLYPDNQSAEAFGADMVGDLNTNFDFSGLEYDDGTNGPLPMNGYFDDAAYHRITSHYTIQNVEVNLLGGCCGVTPWSCGYGAPCGQRLSCNWLAGVRYFQFDEGFSLAADTLDTSIDGDLNEVYYDVDARNALVGFQVGGGFNYVINPCWSLYGTGKAGVYGNDMSVTHRVYGANGDSTITGGAYGGEFCDVTGNRTNLSVIGQLDMGIKWQISCRWSAQVGYRVFGATGVATLADQVPADFTDKGAMGEIRNGNLMLHGGYAGVQFCF